MRHERYGKTLRRSRFIPTIRSAMSLAERRSPSSGYWEAAQPQLEAENDEKHCGLFPAWVNVLRPSERVSFAKGHKVSREGHSARSWRPGRSQETWLHDHSSDRR